MPKKIYLTDIVEKKKERLKKKPFMIEELIKQIDQTSDKTTFYQAIAADGLSIVGEIKKASPSKGLIKEDFDPVALGREYDGCVDAVSVLTEEDYFLGKDEYLKAVSASISLPTLCKDFIVEPNQIYNAKALGASAVLLIVAILTDKQLRDYITITHHLGLDALVETHSKKEIFRALEAGADIIGINNRDLKSFETNIKTTLKLRKHIPKGVLVISESGIDTVDDIKKLKEANIDAVLVGESFMRSGDIAGKAKEFKNAYA